MILDFKVLIHDRLLRLCFLNTDAKISGTGSKACFCILAVIDEFFGEPCADGKVIDFDAGLKESRTHSKVR